MKRDLIIGIVSSLIIGLLAGCRQVDPPLPPDSNIGIKPLWSTHFKSIAIGITPLIHYKGNVIYPAIITDTEPRGGYGLSGLDLETGESKWVFPSDRNQRYAMPYGSSYIYNNMLVVIFNSSVVCFDMDTQELIWQKQVLRTLDVYGYENNVYWVETGNATDQIYTVDIDSGEASVFYTPIPDTGYDFVKLSTHNSFYDNTYMIFTEYHYKGEYQDEKRYVVKYNITTGLVEKTIVPIAPKYPPTAYSDIMIVNGGYCYCASEYMILCIDLLTNSIKWQYKTGYSYDPIHHMSLVGDTLFFSCDRHYAGVNAKTGRRLYDANVDRPKQSTSDGIYVYLNTVRDMFIIDPHSGKRVGTITCPERLTTGSGFDSQVMPTFYDDKIYLMSSSTAYCYPTYPFPDN